MINRDAAPKTQQDQQLRHAINVNPLREVGGLPIELGNMVSSSYLGIIVGSKVFNNTTAIMFTHVTAGDDIIYRIESETLRILFRGDLGFDKSVNVQCRIVPDSRNDLIAYFTDYKNPLRFINMTTPQQSVDDMAYFVNYKTPLDLSSVNVTESGGAIPAGAWFAFIALVDENEVETNFLPSKPIYITQGDLDFNQYDGSDGGIITSKTIQLNISNIDTAFKYVRIVMIPRLAGVYQNGRQFDLRITNSNELFTFTGNETFAERTIESVIVPKVYYDRVKALAYNDNTLYLGNCVEGKDIGAQPYVNNASVIPINSVVNLESLQNSHKDATTLYLKTGFFNDEVIALYVVFNLKNGTKSTAYHLPGRAALDINGINEADTWSTLQVKDSALYTALAGDEHKSISGDGSIYTTLDTNLLESSYPIARMSFWQNASEFYPLTEDWDVKDVNGNVIDTLRGKNVRHHKFPSLRSPWNPFYANVPNKANNAFSTGVKVTLNLPQSIKNQILSTEIYYARRDGNNARVQAQGTFHYMAESNDSLFNPASAYKNVDPNADTIRVASFDLLHLRPNASTFSYCKIDKVLTNVPRTITPESNSSEIGLHVDARVSAVNVHTVSLNTAIRRISRSDSIQNNTIVAVNGYSKPTIDNRQGEDCYVVKFTNPYTPTQNSELFPNIVDGDFLSFPVNGMPVPIITLYTYRQDVYKSFFQQELIFAGRSTDIETVDVFGGDCFLTQYTYRSTGTPETGLPIIKKIGVSFPVQSSSNVWFRQAGDGVGGMYFPRTSISEYLMRINVPDFIKYNNDYSTLNNLEVPIPYDPDFIERDQHLTRIHKTLPQGVERGNLRKMLADDFVDLPTHRGMLVGIGTIGGNLIPHMERGTFKTYGTQQLNTDADSITIKSVDIFNVTPDEILETDLGYGGCQSINTILNTPHGAFWIDRFSGKAFLAGSGLEEITANGLFNFFESALKSEVLNTIYSAGGNVAHDTPSNYFGVHAWYEQRYRRIFLTVLDYSFLQPQKYKGEFGIATFNVGDYITSNGKVYQVVINNDIVTPVGWINLGNPSLYGMPIEWADTAHFKPRYFTAAYYPERKGWVFYSYVPYHAIANESSMYTTPINGTNLWKHGQGFNNFYGVYHPMVVEIVLQHKEVANLQSIAIDMQAANDLPVNPTEVMVYNTRQNSSPVQISTNKNFGNIRFVNNYWLFNTIRDCVVDRSQSMFIGVSENDLQILNTSNINAAKKAFTKAFLNDTFHIVRVTYLPTEQKDVTLFGVQPLAVKSNRL